MHALGKRLKELRKAKGLTQKQLGDYIHKSKAAIGSYEQGIQTPPADVLISLAKLYHISLDQLLGFERGLSYSLDGLNNEQKELFEMLFNEFSRPSGESGQISDDQIKIIYKLIHIFIDQKD